MLSALLKIRLLAILSVLTGSGRKKKRQSLGAMVGFAALMLMSFASMSFLFWHVFDAVMPPFHMLGLDWLSFALAALMAFGIMFIGSVFMAKSQLYEARDNELLLSMPVKPGEILISRLFVLWLVNVAIGLLVALPGLLVYRSAVGFPPGGALNLLLVLLGALPLLAVAVSAVCGWLLHLLTLRVKNKSLATVLLSLVFLGGYFYLSASLNSGINRLAESGQAAAARLGAVAPLVWAGQAATQGSFAALGKLCLFTTLVFLPVFLALSRSFVSTATRRERVTRETRTEKEAKPHSLRSALFRREWARLASSPAYILNGAMGALLSVLGFAALLWKAPAIRAAAAELPFLAELLPLLLTAAVSYAAAMTLITASSISLEGRTLWLLQSLPVEPWEFLRAKLALHLVVGLPGTLLLSLAAAAVSGAHGTALLWLLLFPVLLTLLSAELGLYENLRHPSFQWINETQAVKSGISVLYTMLLVMAAIALPALSLVILSESVPQSLLLALWSLVYAALIAALFLWLRKKGARRLAKLQ